MKHQTAIEGMVIDIQPEQMMQPKLTSNSSCLTSSPTYYVSESAIKLDKLGFQRLYLTNKSTLWLITDKTVPVIVQYDIWYVFCPL